MNGEKRIFFNNLDALRFLAFLGVFASHMPISFPSNSFLAFLKHQGGLGVDFFFVISGFLITFLLLSEKERNGSISLGKFYLRRIFRIWPLYYGVLILISVITVLSVPSIATSVWKNWLLYYPTFLGNFDRIVNLNTTDIFIGGGVLWSIAVEEQFYIFIPLMVFFVKKPRFILLGLLLVHGITILFKLYVIRGYTDHHLAYQILNFHPLSTFDLISMGCLLAFVAHRYTPLLTHFANRLNGVWMLLAAFLFLALNYVLFRFDNVYFDKIIFQELFGFIFCLFVCYVCFNTKAGNYSPGYIRFFNHLGKISFGLYLFHFPVLFLVSKLGMHAVWGSLVSLVITILLSHVSYTYFESYFLRMKERFSVIHTRK